MPLSTANRKALPNKIHQCLYWLMAGNQPDAIFQDGKEGRQVIFRQFFRKTMTQRVNLGLFLKKHGLI